MTAPESRPEGGQPRSPSGRTPQWLLDEQLRQLAETLRDAPFMQPPAPRRRFSRKPRFKPAKLKAPRKPRRVAKRLSTVSTILAIALIGTYYAYPGLPAKVTEVVAGEQFRSPDGGIGPAADARWAQGFPPRGVEAAKEPLGVPAPVDVASTHYSFMKEDAHGKAVSYDPCRPIHYVTRPNNAPPGGQQLITDAFAAASTATGLVFVDDGATAESYRADRSPYQPDRYGKRWAPVLIVWATTKEEPRFPAAAVPGVRALAGLGGSQAIVGSSGSAVYVSGTVQLNAKLFDELVGTPAGEKIAGGVIQHEIGHVLGLNHVQDPTQLMYEHGQNTVTGYAAGDLTGLAQLGQGKCFPNH